MSKAIDNAKMAFKALGCGSVQMMIGGIVAAIMPSNVSIIYKVATYIGSCVVSLCVSEPVSKVVDDGFDAAKEAIEETKKNINILKMKEEDNKE